MSGTMLRGRSTMSSTRLAAAAVLMGLAIAGPAQLRATPVRAAPAPVATWSANVRADASDPAEAKAMGQNEPQVAVDESGQTYVTWQSSPNGVGMSRTMDGRSFTYLGNPDVTKAGFSDVTLAPTTWTYPDRVKADAPGEGGLVFGVLGNTACAPGISGVRGAYSSDQGKTWHANDAGCQPYEVDRPWTAAYTPPQYRGTAQALTHTMVYNFYHDFAPTDAVWVSRSTDGGATWLTPDSLAAQPGSIQQLSSTCNTTPGSIAVDQRGPHAGRVYVAWASSDLQNSIATGCNYTQAQAFDHLYFSYSDDGGSTWTSGTVFNDPCDQLPPAPAVSTTCQDMAAFWTSTAVDDAGTVYQAFPWRDISRPNPEYDIYVAAGHPRADGSVSFDKPYKASVRTGTHYSPWIVAGAAGKIDVVDYATDFVEGVGTFNKPGIAPGSALWNVYMSQSLDGGHSFTESKVSDHFNYFGDYCTVGIFCSPAAPALGWGGDRILYEDFGLAIGPDGGARVAWTDARDSLSASCKPGGSDDSNVGCQRTHTYFSCQVGGVGLHGETVTGCGQSVAASTVPAPGPTAAPVSVGPGLPGTSAAADLRWLALLLAVALLALPPLRRRRPRRSPG
jgi:hypothetical protein